MRGDTSSRAGAALVAVRLCVTALAAAALLVLAATAPAGANAPGARLYNISPAGAPTDASWTAAQFARLTRGGADMIRLNVSMQAVYRCDPETGRPVLQNPDHPWAAIDRFLSAAQAGDHTEVLGVLIGVPVPCVAPRSASQPLTNTDVWADFVEAAARRYGPTDRDDRESTDGDPALADHRFHSDVPIRYWEIHNEPNLEGFWTPTIGSDAHSPQEAAQYARYMCSANALLKRGDPAIQTLNGAPTRGGTGDEPQYLRWLWGSWSNNWWQKWWKSRPASSCHDITAVHAYARVDKPDGVDLGGGVREIADELEAVQRAKADAGIGSQETWITEFGLGSPDEPEVARGERMTVSDSDQASFLRQAYERLDDPGLWEPTKLTRAFWFSVQDYAPPSQQTRWDLRAGLFRSWAEGATPKPSWNQFVDAARHARPSLERGPNGGNSPLPPPGPGYRAPRHLPPREAPPEPGTG